MYEPYLHPTPEVIAQREQAMKNGYMPPYLDPRFQQCVDWRRPVELLTKDTKRSGDLVYRHTDNGEEVLVPNIWYNQPPEVRAEMCRFWAERGEEAAKRAAEDGRGPDAGRMRKQNNRHLREARRFDEDAKAGRPPHDLVNPEPGVLVLETAIQVFPSLWHNRVDTVFVTRAVHTERHRMRVYFDPATWDVKKDGLIYSDEIWLMLLSEALMYEGFPWHAAQDIRFSEQGLQGDDYVDLDVGDEFELGWKYVTREDLRDEEGA